MADCIESSFQKAVGCGSLSRRSLGGLLLAGSFFAFSGKASAQVVPQGTQNVLAFGADPSGNKDSAPAFQAAFAALPPNGGSIYVPDGDFRLNSPVVFSGKGVTLYGNGEQATRIFVTHSGIALAFNQPSPLFMSCVKDVGISATGPQPAQCAISIVYPEFSIFGSQTALIENVSVPSPIYGAGSNFLGGLNLQGCWQSTVRNFKHLAPGGSGPITGSYFMQIGGRSIDIRLVDCTGENSDLGVTLNGYTEGIHLQNCALVSNNFGLTMQQANVDNFEGTPQYFTMGLTISDSEIVARKAALVLNRVLSSYITNSHLGLSGAPAGAAVIYIGDSQDVKINGSTISGQFSNQIGINVSATTYPCMFNQFNDCYFVGLTYSILYGKNVTGNTATNLRVNSGGVLLQNSAYVVDNSGNYSNNAQWVNGQGHQAFLH